MTMKMKRINTEDLIKIKKHLENHFNVSITSNKNAGEIKAIASILDAMGIKDKEEFLKNVSITLYRHIYLNFEVGSVFLSPLEQLGTIAHELQHVLQWEHNPVQFASEYLLKHEKRAEYEVSALSANLELHFRVTGELLDVKELVQHLKWYKCTSKDIKVSEKHLAILSNILKQGGNYSVPVEEIMKFLQ